MNLLEHYIKEVHSIDDITSDFMRKTNSIPKDSLLKIDLTYDCYGQIERRTKVFFRYEWEEIRLKGYFMA